MPTPRLGDFERDIARARDLVGLGQAIGNMTNGLVDATDLYRAALVQGVAAWDRYIHGVVLDRAVEIMLGRLAVGAPSKVGLPLGAVAMLMNEPDAATRELAARSYFAERLAKETYQRPDDVAAALAMVGVKAIWRLPRSQVPSKPRSRLASSSTGATKSCTSATMTLRSPMRSSRWPHSMHSMRYASSMRPSMRSTPSARSFWNQALTTKPVR